MTPYYEDDWVTIYHGDVSDSASQRVIPSQVRIITDPPYGFGSYPTDVSPERPLLKQWVSVHLTVAVFGYPEELIRWCVACGVSPQEWVTWWPTNKFGGRTTLLPRESESIALFGDVCGAKRLMRPRTNLHPMFVAMSRAKGNDPTHAFLGDVWRDPSPGLGGFHIGKRRLHPNEKPLEVMSRLVLLCSNGGDTVIDPYCGSGSTLVAAKALGRRAIGIEIEERYCEIAAQRCAQEVLDFGAVA